MAAFVPGSRTRRQPEQIRQGLGRTLGCRRLRALRIPDEASRFSWAIQLARARQVSR